jgi:vitamin B12 transporter
LQANVRRDFNDQFGTQNTSMLAYGYQIDDQWRAYVSGASAFKAPTFNDLFLPLTCFPPFGCFSGNPQLLPERARNREVGIARETSNQRLNFVYFDNRIRDLIVVGFTQPFNVGNARIRGASAEWNWHDGAWSAGGSLSLQRPRDEDTGQSLIRRPERQMSLNGERTIGAWRLGLDWLLVGRTQDTDFNTGNRVDLGGYGLVGAFAHYALARDWTLELRGDNLGDKRYAQALDFRTAGTTLFAGVRYAPK